MTKKKTSKSKNNEKSNYFQTLLKNYIPSACEISQNEKELTKLRRRLSSIAQGSEYAEEQRKNLCHVIENVCDKLVQTQERLYASRSEAEDIVSRLPSELATILRMRYFLGKPWETIEREMCDRDEHFSRSKMFKIHKIALARGEGIAEHIHKR